MLRIEIEKKIVAKLDFPSRLRALRLETHDRISAVAVQIDQMFDGAQGTRRAIQRDRQPRQSIRRDLVMAGAQLAPRNFAIAVAVEPDREIEVAQRDVPLAVQSTAVGGNRQIAVARLVGQCRPCAQGQYQQPRDAHQLPPLRMAAS